MRLSCYTFVVSCFVILLICICGVSSALPPDPDNAALLYYQAFLARQDIDYSTMEDDIDNVLEGGEAVERLRGYVAEGSEQLELIEAASEITHCLWGFQFSRGRVGAPWLLDIYRLALLVEADALVSAVDRKFETALEKCVLLRQFAQHIGDDTVASYGAAIDTDGVALVCIQHILGSMPSYGSNALTWLQGQLVLIQGAPSSPARALQMDFELVLQSMLHDDLFLAELRHRLQDDAADPCDVLYIQCLTPEELLATAKESYSDFLNSANAIMESGKPYSDIYVELQNLVVTLEEQTQDDYAAHGLALSLVNDVVGLYALKVRHAAHSNAVKAAIKIYSRIAEDGFLPVTLPLFLPKDPFSGEDFEYEITEDGFILRCRAKDLHMCPFPRLGVDPDTCPTHEYRFGALTREVGAD